MMNGDIWLVAFQELRRFFCLHLLWETEDSFWDLPLILNNYNMFQSLFETLYICYSIYPTLGYLKTIIFCILSLMNMRANCSIP